ncbi:MAG: exopolysaccharide biosynthesis protein [Caulobacterales bacterium]|uniref:exopolysaccharide biosynthesis protein n=1 Tax=Glycocaulis sp. TaxID=1969725 RepID=UPI003F9F90FA
MSEVNNLHSLLRNMADGTDGETVSVGDLLKTAGRRSYGPLLLLLGIISVSPLAAIPGANWLFSLITLLIALQILFGRDRPWVPQRLLDHEFSRERLMQGVTASEPYARTIDRFLKPRLNVLTRTPFVQLVALICIGAALVSFPLGFVPLGPLLPGLTVLVFGLAITSNDGLLVIVTGILLAASVWLLVHLWSQIAQSQLMGSVMSLFGGS